MTQCSKCFSKSSLVTPSVSSLLKDRLVLYYKNSEERSRQLVSARFRLLNSGKYSFGGHGQVKGYGDLTTGISWDPKEKKLYSIWKGTKWVADSVFSTVACMSEDWFCPANHSLTLFLTVPLMIASALGEKAYCFHFCQVYFFVLFFNCARCLTLPNCSSKDIFQETFQKYRLFYISTSTAARAMYPYIDIHIYVYEYICTCMHIYIY